MNAKMLLLNDGKRRAFIAAVVELATCPSSSQKTMIVPTQQ